jgi:phage terminase Nu1 subunit (DNA packaging protein)
MGKRVNQTELAEILGKSDVTIWEWQKDGLPIAKQGARGAEHEYDTAEVIAWLEQRAAARAGKGESGREREARLRGDLMEIELAQKRNALVPADEVRPLWESRVLAAAFYMTGRHSRLAGILEATPGIEAKRLVLKKEDADFLTKLGVEGERMQVEVDAMLERLAEGEAQAFLRRLSGHDDQRTGGAEDTPA